MADRAKPQNMAQDSTSFFAGRPERGSHGLCPTIRGAEVDVHRGRTAEGALPAAKSDASSHGQKRFVRPSPPVSDRPRSGVWVPFPLRLDHNLEGWTTFYLSKTSEKGLFPTQGLAHARRKSDQIWDDLELFNSSVLAKDELRDLARDSHSRQGESPSAALTLASICSSHFGEAPGGPLRKSMKTRSVPRHSDTRHPRHSDTP
eukprot:scaffold85794_cov48-Phaeocystis_antarctica.AAC.4